MVVVEVVESEGQDGAETAQAVELRGGKTEARGCRKDKTGQRIPTASRTSSEQERGFPLNRFSSSSPLFLFALSLSRRHKPTSNLLPQSISADNAAELHFLARTNQDKPEL